MSRQRGDIEIRVRPIGAAIDRVEAQHVVGAREIIGRVYHALKTLDADDREAMRADLCGSERRGRRSWEARGAADGRLLDRCKRGRRCGDGIPADINTVSFGRRSYWLLIGRDARYVEQRSGGEARRDGVGDACVRERHIRRRARWERAGEPRAGDRDAVRAYQGVERTGDGLGRTLHSAAIQETNDAE